MKSKTPLTSTRLLELVEELNVARWQLAEMEGEENRAIVAGDGDGADLIADCYAICVEKYGLPGDYQANARFLLHAAQCFAPLYAALEACVERMAVMQEYTQYPLAWPRVMAMDALKQATALIETPAP